LPERLLNNSIYQSRGLVTESDIAKRLNIKRQTASLWISGGRRKNANFKRNLVPAFSFMYP